MIITKDKYKEILEIQGVTYTEGSAWFQTSLERINQALSLANVVGQSEQLLAFKEWERDKCRLPWDAEPKEIVEQYLSQ